MPVQSVTAAHVLSPDPAAPASLWQWLGRLPDPRDPRGVRFTLPCVIAISIAARLAGCDSFTAAGEWAASRPQRVLKALGCPRHKRAGIRVAPSEKTIRRVAGLIDHDLADDLLCGHAAELAAAGGVLSPAQLQEQRRDTARKAKAKARKARDKARKAAKKARAVRGRSQKQARRAARRERKAAAAAIAGGRAKAPQHLGFFWHDTRLNAAQRAVDRKTNETTVIGPVIDGMDLRGVCLTVDALHSLVDLNKRVLARGGHVIFVIKGNQPRTYQALDAIAWEQIPVAAATFEAGRGRAGTRTVQVSAAPAGLKYPGMQQAALIERYTTLKDKNGTAVTRSETVLILTTASPDLAPPADLLALNRGHWAATEATHWVRDTDLKEDSSRARAPGAARFMATVGNAVLNLLRIHGVTNIAAERRRLNGSDRKILKRMGLSTG